MTTTLTEAAFLRQIRELAALLGFHGAHFRPALTARGWRTPVQGSIGAGFVDVVLVSAARRRVLPPRRRVRRVSDRQTACHDALAASCAQKSKRVTWRIPIKVTIPIPVSAAIDSAKSS